MSSMYDSILFISMTIIDDVLLNGSIGMTAYAPLTNRQIAEVLHTALNPSNHYLPIDNPICIPFLMRYIDTLNDLQRVTRSPYGEVLDELIRSNRELLRIGCPIPQVKGDALWNISVGLLDWYDENGKRQDLKDSIDAFRDCLAIANHSTPRWIRLRVLGCRQAKLCINFDSMNNIDEAISTLDRCLKLYSEMPGIDSESTRHYNNHELYWW